MDGLDHEGQAKMANQILYGTDLAPSEQSQRDELRSMQALQKQLLAERASKLAAESMG
jgi:hypothetical protein